MAQALYRKWRSQTFSEVVGQEHVTQTLKNALREQRVAHAYLFSGPRGTGKTSSARILAKALNCTQLKNEEPCNRCPTCVAINEGRMLDLIEIDAASNNSVDDVRELRDKVGFSPSEGQYKIYIIDEVHMLSISAFNALLKTLEEPPPHARFILATTEPHKIPATILSRCQRFDFRRIPVPEIAQHLQHIVQVEGFQAEGEALAAIGRSAQGCMRDAVSLLDQMLSYGTEMVTLMQVQQVLGAVSAEAVADLVDAVVIKDIGQGLTLIQKLLVEGASLTEFCHQVVEHLRGVMVLQMTQNPSLLNELPSDVVAKMQTQAQQSSLATILFAIKRFSETVQELKGGYQPQLPLELALIESVQNQTTQQTVQNQAALQPAQAPAQNMQPMYNAVPQQPMPQQPMPQQPMPQQPMPQQPMPQQPVPHQQATEHPHQNQAQQPVQAPPQPVQQPAPAPEPPPLDENALRNLRSRWKDFVNVVRQRCGIKAQAALNAVRDIAISERTVAFAFGNNQFSRDIIAHPEISAQVASVLSEFFGRQIAVECQLGAQAQLLNAVGVSADTNAQDGPDPLVEFAVSTLGAQVVK
ncbi:MAG: DNA polymerase III subunit gamma/tau [Chloroflexota bacterium]